MFSVPHTYAGSYKYCNKTISQVNVFPNAKAVLRIAKTYLQREFIPGYVVWNRGRAVPDLTCEVLVLLRHSTSPFFSKSLAYIVDNI